MKTIDKHELAAISGGAMSPDAHWVMMHESGGDTHARNPHSTAFGAFQMLVANRRHYMGADYQSTNLDKQYAAASHYVRDRYGSWANAKSFWQGHHWY
jgi:bacteriocin-like protein